MKKLTFMVCCFCCLWCHSYGGYSCLCYSCCVLALVWIWLPRCLLLLQLFLFLVKSCLACWLCLHCVLLSKKAGNGSWRQSSSSSNSSIGLPLLTCVCYYPGQSVLWLLQLQASKVLGACFLPAVCVFIWGPVADTDTRKALLCRVEISNNEKVSDKIPHKNVYFSAQASWPWLVKRGMVTKNPSAWAELRLLPK